MDLVLLIYLLWNSVRLFHPVLTYMGHLHFDNGRTSKNYDVPHEHGPTQCPTCHCPPETFLAFKVKSYILLWVCGGRWVWVAYRI